MGNNNKSSAAAGSIIGHTFCLGFILFLLMVLMLEFAGSAIKVGRQRRITSLTRHSRAAAAANSDEDDAGPGKLVDSGDGGGEVPKRPTFRPEIKYEEFKLPPNYSRLQVPSFAAAGIQSGLAELTGPDQWIPPFFVTVIMKIHSVAEIDEINQEIIVNSAFVLQWEDHLIKLHSLLNKYKTSSEGESEETATIFKSLDPVVLDMIWHPDIFIEKLVKVDKPELMSPPIAVRYNDVTGRIIYSARIRVKMECEMSFHYYPADTQQCKVVLRSSANDRSEMLLLWDENGGVFLEECDEPNYDLRISSVSRNEDLLTIKEAFIKGQVREFSKLEFIIHARRKLSYHLVQTYLPSVFFIIITWLCFLIPSTMVEARVGISMTTLLTLTAMFASVRESTPTVSYVRAIDIWMISCIFFVFLTLLEFTLLVSLRSLKEERAEKSAAADKAKISFNSKPLLGDAMQVVLAEPAANMEIKGSRSSHMLRKHMKAEFQNGVAEFIERFAFLIFSLLFLLFNLVYWPWLFVSSEYFNWEVNPAINCPGPPG